MVLAGSVGAKRFKHFLPDGRVGPAAAWAWLTAAHAPPRAWPCMGWGMAFAVVKVVHYHYHLSLLKNVRFTFTSDHFE